MRDVFDEGTRRTAQECFRSTEITELAFAMPRRASAGASSRRATFQCAEPITRCERARRP